MGRPEEKREAARKEVRREIHTALNKAMLAFTAIGVVLALVFLC